jgi:hypothetical protein
LDFVSFVTSWQKQLVRLVSSQMSILQKTSKDFLNWIWFSQIP